MSFPALSPSSPLSIVYADEDLLVVDKPAGLLTVPGKGPEKQDCLIHRVLAVYPNARIVHRLDQPTSGLVIIPLSYKAQRYIARQFERREVDKSYTAVVGGVIEEDLGQVDLPLICDWPNRPRQKVDHTHGKSALTHFHVLTRQTDRTRVLLKPVTGRSHQLRVHMQALGHPILGDTLYATATLASLSARLLLHATELTFSHPSTGEVVSCRSTPAF